VLCHHGHVVLITLWRSKVVDWRGMARIALPQLGHKVAIEHGLPHLHLLIARHFIRSTMVAAGAEAAHSGLVENLVLVTLTVDVGKHVVDS